MRYSCVEGEVVRNHDKILALFQALNTVLTAVTDFVMKVLTVKKRKAFDWRSVLLQI